MNLLLIEEGRVYVNKQNGSTKIKTCTKNGSKRKSNDQMIDKTPKRNRNNDLSVEGDEAKLTRAQNESNFGNNETDIRSKIGKACFDRGFEQQRA